MLKFRPNVSVMAPDLDFVVRSVHGEYADYLISEGTAAVATTDKRGMVNAIRLTGELANNTARPGSYGIVRQVIDDGTHHSILFQHHRLGRAA